MRKWVWAFWTTAAGISAGFLAGRYSASAPRSIEPTPARTANTIQPRPVPRVNATIVLSEPGPPSIQLRQRQSAPTATAVLDAHEQTQVFKLADEVTGVEHNGVSRGSLKLTSILTGASADQKLEHTDAAANSFALSEPRSNEHTPSPARTWDSLVSPIRLALVDEPENVYPEIMPQRMQENLNGGGVNFGLDIDWLSDYVYRGVDQNTPGRRPENSLQFTAQAKFDLGKLPHPIIGLFVNVFNSDPVSRFEEVRPFFGAEWALKPITIAAGYTSYIYPNRKSVDTQEVYASIGFDDSRLFHTATPIFSPYIYGAYDVDLYKGFYLEAGVRHDFVFEDFGFTFSPVGDVAYVTNNAHYALTPTSRNWGLQHYDVGAIANFSLNHVLRLDHRHGEWSVNGYLYYTGRFDDHLRADNLIWGGVGLEFRY